MKLVPAASFDVPTLTELFNAGFSGYRFPMELSQRGFSDHVNFFDLDLEISQVLVDELPAAFAYVGRRGSTGWIGGMGTTPPHRRRGFGEKVLMAAIESAVADGCSAVGLEVLEDNEPAIRLYRKLGFEHVRELAVWSLAGNPQKPDAAVSAVAVSLAQEWIAAHRTGTEPWQRADGSLLALQRRDVALRALAVKRDGELAAAAIVREQPETTSVLQIVALDEEAAADVLLAAAEGDRTVRLANVPLDDPASRAVKRLGAECVVVQYEMTLTSQTASAWPSS